MVIISNRRITGLTAGVIAELVEEVGPLWQERHQARVAARLRKRVVGAGAKCRLVFVDRPPPPGLDDLDQRPPANSRLITTSHRP
ncbi:hypothetical protein ACFXBB_37735 [Streptomyces scopuliridis]|uniref:hypothetical protein n=1 Tax=Streptomyces scopuliridis TaxID=452529 RepID=UPI0036C62F3F